MIDKALYVQYGSGNIAVPGWLSFDASPTLRIQKIPLLGCLLRSKLNCIFDDEILYGNIVRGLPLADNSVDGLFCSHVLEHLSYSDCERALANSFRYLKPGGVFRIIVPDLSFYIQQYLNAKPHGEKSVEKLVEKNAAYEFMKGTSLGLLGSRIGIRRRLIDAFSNSQHRWMWDYEALSSALSDHGFTEIKRFVQGVCEDEMLLRPERAHQFGGELGQYGLAIQCRKPV